jgi:hypothetical protein
MNENNKSYITKGRIFIKLIFFLLLITMHNSCKKLVEAPPPSDQVSEINVFSNDATAISVLTDIYVKMNAIYGPFQGYLSTSIFAGLSADEFTLYSGAAGSSFSRYYENDLSITFSAGYDMWAPLYNYIYKCNAAITGLNASTSLTPAIKKQLLGEAKFMRAFCYFYLVNFFGDVPLALTTDATTNSLLARTPKADVYKQIETDLLDAEANLGANFLNITLSAPTPERVRPTQWAAKSMLARVYLYTGKYAEAETKATEVINNTTLFTLVPDINQVFLKNSREAIWQLQPTEIGFNTIDAMTLIITDAGLNPYLNMVYLSDQLLNSFEAGDLRAKPKNWIDTIRVGPDFYHFPYKYKQGQYDPNITSETGTIFMTEYFMVLRLGEQYLIRAEARAQQNKIAESRNDLLAIRRRAGLSDATLTANDQPTLLSAVLHERQTELFTELGQRWFDLKRTGKVDALMTVVTPQKSNGATQWKSYQQLYPLSLMELQKAPNVVQTPGY